MLEHEIWLAWAQKDLKIAKIILHDEEVEISGVLYHCQQCIEKSYKAYLFYKKQSVPKTHDLIQLMKLCAKFDHDLTTLTAISLDLDPHITYSRYPDSAFIMPDLTTATILFKQTEDAFNFVKNKIDQT